MSWAADAAAAWQRHLEQARWFSGKGRSARVSALTALDWYTPAGSWPAVRSELATVSYPDGPDEVFQLLVGYVRPEPRTSRPRWVGYASTIWARWSSSMPPRTAAR